MVTVIMTHLPQGHTITPSHRAPQSHKVTTVHMESYTSYPLHQPNQLTQVRDSGPAGTAPSDPQDTPEEQSAVPKTETAHLALFPFRRGPGSRRRGKGVGVGDLFPPGTSGKCSPEPIRLDKMAHSPLDFPLLHGLGRAYSPALLSESLPEIFEIQTQAQSDPPTRGRSHTLETSFLHRPCRSEGVIRSLRNKKDSQSRPGS